MDANAPVFLAASVPDTRRVPRYAQSADSVAIASAVGALVHVVLGRRRLVWGGHPAITPMVYAVAEGLGVDYSKWVTLYQSSHFEERYPEDNEKFQNIVYTSEAGSRADSLKLMRVQMFEENKFGAAVFIGGMEGIVEEFWLLRAMQPDAAIVPIVSTGGAVLDIAGELPPDFTTDLEFDLDYISLFHRHLAIPFAEKRYVDPREQPLELGRRLRQTPDR